MKDDWIGKSVILIENCLSFYHTLLVIFVFFCVLFCDVIFEWLGSQHNKYFEYNQI
jgi:hypothetical protein